eukprot:XP_017952704.1 PREDICTED: uncharacterized protein LOC108644517 [Xenopus tropicalis]
MASNKQLVGIFSRDARETYDWLIRFLLTISAVRDVRPVHISNTNYENVWDEASKCAFAILYHTTRRGRINITDVTDSLYDRELGDLSRCLGLPSAPVMVSNRQLVGIFSRESQEAYDWLITFLLTISAVRDVRTVHISNTNYRDVIDEASKCAFAILYHTKKRGRINITDVTDSLYDRELEDLSRCLGRDRVIVVIDDLEDSSLEAKNLILQNQPSIGRWAVELFLFSDQEKTYHGTASRGYKMTELATLIKNADKKFCHGHPVPVPVAHNEPTSLLVKDFYNVNYKDPRQKCKSTKGCKMCLMELM